MVTFRFSWQQHRSLPRADSLNLVHSILYIWLVQDCYLMRRYCKEIYIGWTYFSIWLSPPPQNSQTLCAPTAVRSSELRLWWTLPKRWGGSRSGWRCLPWSRSGWTATGGGTFGWAMLVLCINQQRMSCLYSHDVTKSTELRVDFHLGWIDLEWERVRLDGRELLEIQLILTFQGNLWIFFCLRAI